ncbi:hypothetical protein A3Q56_01559 [Intoshia linei]|uniref:Uncharacterized protein n=1 Tax=Intoshia linei TaxID=1819745 RepID=A0A177BAN3_9BILA|nr:hypothetical protein A3Q56_01559 [Intoshia linei]
MENIFVCTLMCVLSLMSSLSQNSIYLDGQSCSTQIVVSGTSIYSHSGFNQRLAFSKNIECTIRLVSKFKNGHINLMVKSFHLPQNFENIDNQCHSVLYIFNFNKKKDDGTNGYCGKKIFENYLSIGPNMTLYFKTQRNTVGGYGFHIIATAVYQNKYCADNFQCRSSQYCIDKDLICDGTKHCFDESDESTIMLCKELLKINEGLKIAKNTQKTSKVNFSSPPSIC